MAALRWLVACCVALAAAQAFAQSGDSITVAWGDAAGPVVGYDVFVSINGDALFYYDTVDGAEVEIGGPPFQEGDAVQVRVVAIAADGRQGPPSEISDVIYFTNVPAPTGMAVVNGSARYPIRVSWDAVPHVQSYVVFRSAVAGQLGRYLARTEMPWIDDATATLGVVYHYTIAAINGRQVSAFSQTVSGTRGGSLPELQVSPGSLSFSIDPDEPVASQTLRFSNAGDWQLQFTAWPSVPWIQVSHTVGDIDGLPVDVSVTVNATNLASGTHAGSVRVFTYYEPPAGSEFELGPPLVIPVQVTVSPRNEPPSIDSPLQATLYEGQVLAVSVLASDPDEGDRLDVGMGQLPAFATFESLGDGAGRLILAPDYESAGVYQPVLVAWDNSHYIVEPFTITVRDRNRSPQVAVIPDTTIPAGSTSTVLVFAWDPDLGDRIAMTTSALPDFATFVDLGNGTGRFEFTPGPEDVGDVLIVLGVVDDGSPVGFVGMSFLLSVEP